MPGPPPPPPPMAPPPMMPPAPAFVPPKGGANDRSALLKSIQKGTKLKKTVTNDKSAPMMGGKIAGLNNNNNNHNNGNNNNNRITPGGNSSSSISGGPPQPNGLNLGDLFAGGMPKLRTTGKFNTNLSNNDHIVTSTVKWKPEIPSQPSKSLNNVQNELKKQMANDNKNRGPPPPAPIRNISQDELTNNQRLQNMKHANSSNGLQQLQPNPSTLHRKAKSNISLYNFDTIDSVNDTSIQYLQQQQHHKPVINYGKPNLAPKPPVLNGKPVTPPKKLVINGKPISRAQSMKSPRSPSPQQQQQQQLQFQQNCDSSAAAIKFGTVRNLSSVIGQSLGHSTGNLSSRPRPLLFNGRPTAPPPSIPSQLSLSNTISNDLVSTTPLPPAKTNVVRPPNHAPPPPPSSASLPQPPNHAPPPPPHRTGPMRPPPAIPSSNVNNINNNNNNNNAPPPPPRHSSMTTPRKHVDFDEKFKLMFHHPNTFPKPPPYKNCLKLYSTKQVGSKQQAPQPPQMQSVNKGWDMSTTC